MEEHVEEHASEWERDGLVPTHLWDTFNKHNMLVPNLPCPLPVEVLHKAGIRDVLGIRVEDFDLLHVCIYWDEMARFGSVYASMSAGMTYAISPIIKYGSPKLQKQFLPDLLTGKKRTCLAVTEPSAGSDVANISTTANKSACGKYYLVTGNKKWITNGIWSDYSTMAVRTGGPGPAGLSLLIVPLLNTPGVSMRPIKTLGAGLTGTTYIDLDEVKVPVTNLIGKENHGMKMIMTNFNHERLQICVSGCRNSRTALSSAFEYTMAREAFGKPLMDQPVVRHRLAKAGAQLESLSAWIESLAYQMSQMESRTASEELGGLTAMMKAQTGIVFDECARCAVLLFGGAGLTQDEGKGATVEKLYRAVPAARIPGGSEDVLLDLGIRELAKRFKAKTATLKKGNSKL